MPPDTVESRSSPLYDLDSDDAVYHFSTLFSTPPSTLQPLFAFIHQRGLLLPALYEWLDGWEEHYTLFPHQSVVRIRGETVTRRLATPGEREGWRTLLLEVVSMLGEETECLHDVYRKQLETCFAITF